MSQHKTPLTDLEREGLLAYRLPVGEPSQLSDAFRNGMAWALSSLRNDAGSESNPDEAVYPVGGEHMPDEWEEVLVWCDRYKRWVPGHWFTHFGSKEVRWNVNGTTGPVSFIKQPRYWRKMPAGVIEKEENGGCE